MKLFYLHHLVFLFLVTLRNLFGNYLSNVNLIMNLFLLRYTFLFSKFILYSFFFGVGGYKSKTLFWTSELFVFIYAFAPSCFDVTFWTPLIYFIFTFVQICLCFEQAIGKGKLLNRGMERDCDVGGRQRTRCDNFPFSCILMLNHYLCDNTIC